MMNKFKLQGLTCPACGQLASKRLAKIAGVTRVEINHLTGACNLEAERELTIAEVNQVLADTDFSVAVT